MKAEKPMYSEALRKIPSVMRVGNTVVPYHCFSSDPVFNAKLKAVFRLHSSILQLSAMCCPLSECFFYKAIWLSSIILLSTAKISKKGLWLYPIFFSLQTIRTGQSFCFLFIISFQSQSFSDTDALEQHEMAWTAKKQAKYYLLQKSFFFSKTSKPRGSHYSM